MRPRQPESGARPAAVPDPPAPVVAGRAAARVCCRAMLTPRRASWALALAAAWLVVAPPARAAYHALEEIPTESPVYRLVEELATNYGFGVSFLHTEPWTRAELGQFLDQLAATAPASATDPDMIRLRRELAPSDALGGWEPAEVLEDTTSSLELSPYARADYTEDRARHDIDRDFRVGGQASYAPTPDVMLWSDVYAGTRSEGGHGNPVASVHFGIIEGVQFNSYFDRADAMWSGKLGRVELGHTWLRWGPGAWGTMALSDAAPAFDVLEVRTPILRRAQLEWFVASLDPATQSYLAGHRLEIRPTQRLDLSFGELARFDGTASVPLYLLPVVPYSLIEKRIIDDSSLPSDSLNGLGKNNVMWTMDAAYQARPYLRTYGELAIDDISFSSEKRPRALAWQIGFDARRVQDGGAWTLRGEYSRVYQYTYSVWHHHDFDFAGVSTAFPLGPDVDRLNGRLEWRSGPEWAFGIEGAFQRKGEGELGEYYVPGSGPVNNLVLSGILDIDSRAATTVDYSPAPGLVAGLTLGMARVTNLNHELGDDPHGVYGQTRFTVRW